MRDIHTLQLWPSGKGYEYRSDATELHYGFPGLGDHKRLRRHSVNGEPSKRWRKGTQAEWAAIVLELRVERYIEIEILKCDSCLVSDALALGQCLPWGDSDLPRSFSEEWSYENVTNLNPDPEEWNAVQCCDWLDDHGIDHPSEVPRLGDSPQVDEDAHAVVLREAINDHAEPAEIYEWWAVSDWLARQLTSIGECVLDNAYGYWWGRQATGQAMKMDGTLQQIARRFDDA